VRWLLLGASCSSSPLEHLDDLDKMRRLETANMA
jgi:hypothetical protein